jgi:lon-related putative ATP-dependent protease
MSGIRALAPNQLYQSCDLSALEFEDTTELTPPAETIGQERALEAIEFGVGIDHDGYNLFLMGSTGLGKHRVIRQSLERHRERAAPPADWCYVANFGEPHRPRALKLPAGRGRELRQDLYQLVDDLLNALPAAFQSDEYNQRAEEIASEFKSLEEKAAEALGKKAKEQGIALIHTPGGYTLAPVRDGHILSNEAFDSLPDEDKAHLEQVMQELKEELRQTMSQVPVWQREMRKRFKALDRDVAQATVNQLVAELGQRYAELPPVMEYLQALELDVVDNLDQFRHSEGGDSKALSPDDAQFNRYKVNLLVDNAEVTGAPVVYENNPNYLNLVGRIEHISRLGTLMTDFTLIKPGALHRANGGFLILDAVKVLTNPFAWEALKRVLKAREIRIEALERLLSLAGTTSLEPQEIPLDIKVALLGDRLLYYLLKAYDPEFGQLFKVAADFAEEMPRMTGQDGLYGRFVAGLQQREKLRPLERAAVELVVERAARRAQDADKLSLDVSSLLDLMKEADFQARRAQSERIRREDVASALEAQQRRVDQLREHIQEEILRGGLMIDTRGSQLGRVNALSVIFTGDHGFGIPSRISATARLGSGEVVDIQREVDQAGPIHSKGVFILSSYLARRYAKFQPLCLSASLAFEQTYGLVEGDSASAAELCALLSAIGDIPLRQSMAITGSVNQHGEIQAIGGVNEKIEGFFDICQGRGLTGEHGVIIPDANRHHLMLRADVIDAVASGAFQVYAVHHVDEAMELLTGQSAGQPDAEGLYPADSVNGQVQLRLSEWFALRQQLAGGEHQRHQD